MKKAELEKLVNNAIDKLFDKDRELLVKSYDIHERTVAHRLAVYIEQLLNNPNYDVDIEYNRMREEYGSDDVGNLIGKRLNWEKSGEGSNFVYPDIIVHKRDTSDNLIEIEIKMSWKNRKREFDYAKINEYMKQLDYKFGVYIELNEAREACLVEFGPFGEK